MFKISWNLADVNQQSRALFTLQKKTKFRLAVRLLLLRGSRLKYARASNRQCTQSAPDFTQIGSLSAELYPNAWTPSALQSEHNIRLKPSFEPTNKVYLLCGRFPILVSRSRGLTISNLTGIISRSWTAHWPFGVYTRGTLHNKCSDPKAKLVLFFAGPCCWGYWIKEMAWTRMVSFHRTPCRSVEHSTGVTTVCDALSCFGFLLQLIL